MATRNRDKDDRLCLKMLLQEFKKSQKFLADEKNIKYLWDRQNMCMSALYLLEQQPNRVPIPYDDLVKNMQYEKKIFVDHD